MTDILEELDAVRSMGPNDPIPALCQRARKHIAALREKVEHLETVAMTPSDELHSLLRERDAARDEIAGLREEIENFAASMPTRMNELSIAVRAKALEEAALKCDELVSSYTANACAAAIRALKDTKA